MRKLFIAIIIISASFCSNPVDNPAPAVSHVPTYADTLAMLDTAYADPATGHIKPPCSMTSDYCACLVARGAVRSRIPNCR